MRLPAAALIAVIVAVVVATGAEPRAAERAACQSDFHRLPVKTFYDCLTSWISRGLRPMTLSAYEWRPGDIRLAGSFQPRGGRKFPPVRILMTAAKLKQHIWGHKGEGYRPARISVTERLKGPPLFSAIWTRSTGPFETDIALAPGAFTKKWKARRAAGYLHADMAVYRVGGKLRIASTWVKRDHPGYATRVGMTRNDFEARTRAHAKKGYVVTHLQPYIHNGIKYAAIWEKRTGDWRYARLLSAPEYQTQWSAHRAKGRRLHQVVAAADPTTGDEFFTAIWK